MDLNIKVDDDFTFEVFEEGEEETGNIEDCDKDCNLNNTDDIMLYNDIEIKKEIEDIEVEENDLEIDTKEVKEEIESDGEEIEMLPFEITSLTVESLPDDDNIILTISSEEVFKDTSKNEEISKELSSENKENVPDNSPNIIETTPVPQSISEKISDISKVPTCVINEKSKISKVLPVKSEPKKLNTCKSIVPSSKIDFKFKTELLDSGGKCKNFVLNKPKVYNRPFKFRNYRNSNFSNRDSSIIPVQNRFRKPYHYFRQNFSNRTFNSQNWHNYNSNSNNNFIFNSPETWNTYITILNALNQLIQQNHQKSQTFSNSLTFENDYRFRREDNFRRHFSGPSNFNFERPNCWNNETATYSFQNNTFCNILPSQGFNMAHNHSQIQTYSTILCAINQLANSITSKNGNLTAFTNNVTFSMSCFNLFRSN